MSTTAKISPNTSPRIPFFNKLAFFFSPSLSASERISTGAISTISFTSSVNVSAIVFAISFASSSDFCSTVMLRMLESVFEETVMSLRSLSVSYR